MEHTEMVALIRGGVPAGDGVWADLGAGSGNFTRALRALLSPQAVIHAVDRDAKALALQQQALAAADEGAAIQLLQADITRPLRLPELDGVLMANVLHFLRDHVGQLRHVAQYLQPGGRVLIVEYDVALPIPWVPFPLPIAQFENRVHAAGFVDARVISTRRSPSSGRVMYAGVASRAN
jgi:trans-aconitate methyltransferase